MWGSKGSEGSEGSKHAIDHGAWVIHYLLTLPSRGARATDYGLRARIPRGGLAFAVMELELELELE